MKQSSRCKWAAATARMLGYKIIVEMGDVQIICPKGEIMAWGGRGLELYHLVVQNHMKKHYGVEYKFKDEQGESCGNSTS